MNRFENLTKPELELKLAELKDLFDEVTEERSMILGQENLHLPGGLVQKYENELNDIKSDIALVESILNL